MEVKQRRRNNSFFFLIFLFIWANILYYILMIFEWFKTKACFRFYHQLFMTQLRIRGNSRTKTWFRNRFFHLLIFETYGNLEIDFSINLNKHFRAVMNTLKSHCFFVKVLTHCKTNSKHAVVMPLHHTFCLTCFYNCIKLYCPKVREYPELYGKKKSYFTC